MSKTIWKKALATSLALLMVSGAVPVKPVTDLASRMAVTAYAAGELTSATTDWSGEYTVSDNITISRDITLTGNTALHIAAGKTLTVNGTINVNSKTLTVNGSGTLNVAGNDGAFGENGQDGADGQDGGNAGWGEEGSAAIAYGSLILNGATVIATGGNGGNGGNGGSGAEPVYDDEGNCISERGNGGNGGSGAEPVYDDEGNCISERGNGGNGGKGGNGGCGVSGVITVNSGELRATGGNGGRGGRHGFGDDYNNDGSFGGDGNDGIWGTLTVNGGSVIATGGDGGGRQNEFDCDGCHGYCFNANVVLDGGTLTANCDGRFALDDYWGKMIIAARRIYTDNSGNIYTGELDRGQIWSLNRNRTLSPVKKTLTLPTGITKGTVTADQTGAVRIGDTVTLTVTPDVGYHADSVTAGSAEVTKVDDTHFSFTMPNEDVTVSGECKPNAYTVAFDGNNDDASGEMTSQAFTYDEEAKALTECSFVSSYDIFTGWNTKADGSGTGYTDGQSVRNLTAENGGTVTLYAQWQHKMEETTILLDDFDESDFAVYPYNADNPTVTPTVVVIGHNDTTLTEGRDYTVAFTNNTGSPNKVVAATVTVTGMGSYVGTNTRKFRIHPTDIALCKLKGKFEAYDDGYGPYYPLANNVQVWYGETQLRVDLDYVIELDPDIDIYSYKVGKTYQASIVGMGFWKGSKTFDFTFTELSHTVVFDANGGTGTIANGSVTNKHPCYTLPECKFTAPYGYEFDYWEVSCEPDEEKQPGDYFTATTIYNESDVQTITVKAIWKEKAKYSVTLPDHMKVVSGIVTDGKAYQDEVITFTTEDGYSVIGDVKVGDETLTPDANGVYTVTVTDAAITVTAAFLGPNECVFDESTNTLHLRGKVDKNDVQQYRDRAVHVVADVGAVLPQNSSELFDSFSQATSMDLANADTSNVTMMFYMFYDCTALTSVDLSNFNTSRVTDMDGMFCNCKSLTTLDLSSFDTSSVEDMSIMFSYCNALTTLDLSSFDTSSVEDMSIMFSYCNALTTLDLSSFDTSSVEDMSVMFSNCNALTTLDLSSFDTSSVTDMRCMFTNCSTLTSLDLSSFDTNSLSYLYQMFANCSSLTSIYVGDGWSTDAEEIVSDDMFYNCTRLKGGAGTKYNYRFTDKNYARIDGGTENPGYFTAFYTLVPAVEPTYTTEGNSAYYTGADGKYYVLTDGRYVRTTLEAVTIPMLESTAVDINIIADHCSVTATVDGSPVNAAHYNDTVTLSFAPDAGYEVKSYTVTKEDGTAVPVTNNSFTMPDSVVTVSAIVEKIHYTITKSVTHGTIITTVDGSPVNTAHYNDTVTLSFVPDAGYEVKSYTVTKKDGTAVPVTDNSFTMPDSAVTVSVTVDVPSTFDSTTGTLTLKGTILKGSNYDSTMILPAGVNKTDVKKIVVDPAGATFPANASYLFFSFSNVTDINLQGVDSGSVTNMANMFYGCKSLTSLDLTGFDTHAVTDFGTMFGYCEQLVSLDLSGFDTGAAEIMGSMFMYCSELVSLDLSSFTTGKVTNMYCMFYDCGKLTSLNLSGFDTGKVTLMTQMFERCKKLTTVYVGDGWRTDAVTDSVRMFYGCTSLKGGAGTKYDYRFTEKNYAHIDGGTENPGYLTAFYTLVPAVEPTYTTEGNSAYYIGADGKYYVLTDGGYVEIEENAWVLPMLEKTAVVINSVDINGIKTPTTVYAETYADGDYTVPSAPYLDGYTFNGWKVNSTLCTTAEDVQTAIAAAVAEKPESVTVAVEYEKLPATYTVTVANGTLKNGETSGSYQASEQLYAVASATNADGQKFSCWKIDEKIVGYETTYAFRMPSADMTLTAEYAPAETTIEKVGTGYIESVKRPAANKLSFVSILSVPDGCQMLKAGVVVQSTETLSGAELTKENAKLIKFSDTSKKQYSSFKYTWTMSTSNHTKQWTVRPYLEYTDANGDTQVIYGDAVSKCVNDVSM